MSNVSFEDKIKNYCSRTRMLSKLTFKAPITPEPKFVTSFLNSREIRFIFHVNHLPADDSHEISNLIIKLKT